ncbi:MULTISPECIES: hypothetical protein [unclassified Rhizobium]|jgi:hypothetical protein|uniref:hypothetical protein n=1 Tax=unclassified Rhizobium TaxID=2613769 RepID=UPI0018E96FF9|nr:MULTISPECIES: hypothetical protein [unclassified Rhizobium]MDM9620351.1 hypothetical protein [Rhizobium sp. S96]
MSLLIFAAVAYLALALIVVVAVDNVVALFFRDTRPSLDLRATTFDKVIAISRRYYRK